MIDHQTQQHKLLPLLATVYAFYTTGEYILALNEQALSQFENNQFDLLPEVGVSLPPSLCLSTHINYWYMFCYTQLHATACGLKAFMTHTASNGIEVQLCKTCHTINLGTTLCPRLQCCSCSIYSFSAVFIIILYSILEIVFHSHNFLLDVSAGLWYPWLLTE